MNFTPSFTLDDCLSECDLSAPGARELKDLRVTVIVPDAYGAGSDPVVVDKIFPIAVGVIEKARRKTAFRSKLGGVLTTLLGVELHKSYPGILCRCWQRRPVKGFSTRRFYYLSPEKLEIYAISIPFCDIPEHFSKSTQVANSPLFAEMMAQDLNTSRVKYRVFQYCAGCEKGGKERKMVFCSRCGVCPYCSRECQKAHWKEHKEVCSPSAEQTVP
jgi:hypothetical protein